MSITKVANIIVPENFSKYVTKRTAQMSALVQSGIVDNDPYFDALASGGGVTLNMPYFKSLTGNSEVLSETTALTAQNITAVKDIAVRLLRGKAFGASDLSGALAGADPVKAIGDLFAEFWVNDMQDTLISILKGIQTAAATNVHDISGESGDAAKFTGSTFIDACQKLGDNKNFLSGLIMHSAVEAALRKQDLLDTVKPSDAMPYNTYQGKRIIVDDRCPLSSTVYTSYIFGQGAVANGNGVPTESNFPVFEAARDALGGVSYLITRKSMVLHVRGIKFTSNTITDNTPSNTDLEVAANWEKVYETKQIRLVQFLHKI